MIRKTLLLFVSVVTFVQCMERTCDVLSLAACEIRDAQILCLKPTHEKWVLYDVKIPRKKITIFESQEDRKNSSPLLCTVQEISDNGSLADAYEAYIDWKTVQLWRDRYEQLRQNPYSLREESSSPPYFSH